MVAYTNCAKDKPLDAFLADEVFADAPVHVVAADVEGFARFMERHITGLDVEKAAMRVFA